MVAKTKKDDGQLDREVEYIWRAYSSFRDDAHRHSAERSTISSVLLGISAALIGFVGALWEKLENIFVPAGLIIILGLAGMLFARKLYERQMRSFDRARYFYDRLETVLPSVGFAAAREEADKEDAIRATLGPLHVHVIWMLINAAVAVAGGALIALKCGFQL